MSYIYMSICSYGADREEKKTRRVCLVFYLSTRLTAQVWASFAALSGMILSFPQTARCLDQREMTDHARAIVSR